MKKIAFCTDFSENAHGAFKMALELAEKFQAKLFLVHVLPPAVTPVVADMEWVLPDEPRDELLAQSTERMNTFYLSKAEGLVDCEPVVLDGPVSAQILNFLETRRIDLVVVGSYGLSGVGLVIFGSVAKSVVQKAPCSVMVARPQNQQGE